MYANTNTNEMLTKPAAIGSLLLAIFILSITESLLGCFWEIKTNQCTEDCEFCGARGKLYTSAWIQQSWSWFQSRPGFLSDRWQHLSPARAMASRRKERSSQIISDGRSEGWDDVDVYIPSCLGGWVIWYTLDIGGVYWYTGCPKNVLIEQNHNKYWVLWG